MADVVPIAEALPVLPLRNAVLFPGAIAPFDIGRQKSIAAFKAAEKQSPPLIACFAQLLPATEDPGLPDLHSIGCTARILKALPHSSGNYSLILQGLKRVRLGDVVQAVPYINAKVTPLDETMDDAAELLAKELRDTAKAVIELMPELPREAGQLIDSVTSPSAIADLIAHNLDASVAEKGQLLELLDVNERIRRVLSLLTRQLEVLKTLRGRSP